MDSKKVTAVNLLQYKELGEKITALSLYDYPQAKIADENMIDIILIGDSLGMVFRGEANTLSVSVDDIAYHTAAVKRAVNRALVVADMPFMSYKISYDEALSNGTKLIKAGAEAVKIEGGTQDMVDLAARFTTAGIPVMGHLGLTPQSIHSLGGFKLQGKDQTKADQILDEALKLESAGAFSIVLECIPTDLAKDISSRLKIPTIGIGAGISCDGQILVAADMFGLSAGKSPKFVKCYANVSKLMGESISAYISDVKNSSFPAEIHSYKGKKPKLKVL
ncbi:MAG: 3-methyl-2-oxobutanoate hydroxymethyltransferase [Nitrospinota bacterium]